MTDKFVRKPSSSFFVFNPLERGALSTFVFRQNIPCLKEETEEEKKRKKEKVEK